MLFRFDISGITVSAYQITGVMLLIAVILDLYKNRISLSIASLEFISAIGLFLLLCVASVFFLKSYTDASVQQYIKGIITLVGNFSILLAVVLFIEKSDEHKKFFLKSFNYTIKVLIIYGIIQLLFYITKYDLNSKIVDTLGLDVPYASNLMGLFMRASSLMWDANFFGFQLLLYLFVYLKYQDKDSVFKNDGVFALLALILLAFTFSRSIFLGLAVFVLFNLKRKISAKLASRLVLLIVAFVGILIYIYQRFKVALEPIIMSRFGFLVDDKYVTSSTTARADFWDIGLDLIFKHPFGIGYGNYSEYGQVHFGDAFVKLHSSFLQLGVEVGLITALFHYFILYYFIIHRDTISSKKFRYAVLLSLVSISLFYDQTLYGFTYLFLILNYIPLMNKKTVLE